jgi:hypothetical protein
VRIDDARAEVSIGFGHVLVHRIVSLQESFVRKPIAPVTRLEVAAT